MLLNLGTPDAPTTPAVRRYLAEFLSDPRVIDINPVGRWLLLHLIILRTRPAKSAEAYQKIWSDRGSPLLFYSRDLAAGVQATLGDGWKVALGMRYGAPSIASALAELDGCERIVVIPLFPQYASSSTGSALEELYGLAGARELVPPLVVVPPFHDDAGFLGAFASVGRAAVDALGPDHVLFSFHGIPERHIRRIHPTCFDAEACTHPDCYRGQCQATAKAIADALALPKWSVSYQSRLGRTPWIRPFTDHVLDDLAKEGVKRLAVFCPAFVADCLETLEEIGIRAREQFRAGGGEELALVPSLNATPAWIQAVAAMARRT